jgi:isopentenyl phosphate kinase
MQLLKLGGSVITKKHEHMAADPKNIRVLARVVAKAWKNGVRDLIIVHGAGSFGHTFVLKMKLNNGIRTAQQKLGYAKTHAACAYLSSLVVDALLDNGVPAISIPPSSVIRQHNKRIAKFDEKLVFGYLKAGFIPVLYGDMVPDTKLGGSVCSGDQIIAYLGKKSKHIVLGTNVDGVLADGKVVPKITHRNFGKIRRHLRKSGAPDVTGGMAGKINELLKVGKPAYVVNAKKPERILALLMGKKALSTEIRF